MNVETEIVEMHKILARMEGKFDALSSLPQRVSNLEQWQSWLKGGLGVLAAGFAYVFKGIYGK